MIVPRPARALAAVAFAGLAFAAAPASAQSAETMSDGARAALRAEIRAYLLDNPEVVMEALQELERRRRAEAEAEDEQLATLLEDELTNDGYSYVGGDPDGDVTVVEFLDYNCGYCKKAHADVQALVRMDGDLRYVIKEFPILGPNSRIASRAAMAAMMQGDQDDYYEFHDRMMSHRGALDEKTIFALAERSGLDVERLRRDAESDEIEQKISRNYALAKKLRIEGTPTFVIGGKLVRGFVPLQQLQATVAEVRENKG